MAGVRRSPGRARERSTVAFLEPNASSSEKEVHYFLDIDFVEQVALVALADEDGRSAGGRAGRAGLLYCRARRPQRVRAARRQRIGVFSAVEDSRLRLSEAGERERAWRSRDRGTPRGLRTHGRGMAAWRSNRSAEQRSHIGLRPRRTEPAFRVGFLLFGGQCSPCRRQDGGCAQLPQAVRRGRIRARRQLAVAYTELIGVSITADPTVPEILMTIRSPRPWERLFARSRRRVLCRAMPNAGGPRFPWSGDDPPPNKNRQCLPTLPSRETFALRVRSLKEHFSQRGCRHGVHPFGKRNAAGRRSPHRRPALGRGAGLPLDQRALLSHPPDERAADLQRPPGLELGPGDPVRASVPRVFGNGRRRRQSRRRRHDHLRPLVRHHRLPRRLARARRRDGGARISVLGDPARRAGSRDGTALALLFRLAARLQRARLCRRSHRRAALARSRAHPGRSPGDPARNPRSRAAALSQRRRGAPLQRAAEARLSQRRHRLSGAGSGGADDVAGDGRRLSLAGPRCSTGASRRGRSTSSSRPASSPSSSSTS